MPGNRPQPGRGEEQIGLFERIKGRILLPVWGAEALYHRPLAR